MGWSGVGDREGRGKVSDATADDGEGNDDTLRNMASPTNSAVSSEGTTTYSVESNDRRRKWSTEKTHKVMYCYNNVKKEQVLLNV